MNGGLNGTMEESPDAVVSEPPIDHKIALSEECDLQKNSENSNNTENSNHSDNAELRNDLQSDVEQENDSIKSGGDHKPDKCSTSTSELPAEEIINNDLISNHCSNSNESYPESVTSSQDKYDDDEKDSVHSANEKSEDKKICDNYLKTVTDEREAHDIDSNCSYDEEGSVLSGGPRAEDTVSIDSESGDNDDTSQESQGKNGNNDIIILETESQNGNSRSSACLEVHEITSDNDDEDDCILTNDEKSNYSATESLRRSSRAIKHESYDDDIENGDDESDIEEVEMEDPLNGKCQFLVVKNTNNFVEMTSKKMKLNQSIDKNHASMVIINSHSAKMQSTQGKNSSTKSAQSLYQTIAARGTTVTPVKSKSNAASQSSPQNPQTAILPSLTDDMFVVEAPSFIVPYVYEKPSVKPFREFVDKLGKELDEQKAKEEKEQIEKKRQEKEKRDKDRKERGENVSELEDKAKNMDPEEDEKKKKKAEKRERRRRRNYDEDDASWDGENTSESEEEETLSDDESLIIKDKSNSIEEIKDVTDLTVDKISISKSDSYFDCSLGNFFVNIGLSLVQEHVQTDLLKQQNRKLVREKKSGRSTKETQSAIASLMKNLEFSKENNAPYAFTQKKCEFCSFKTESLLALNHHLETPHMKNNLYKCNFCEFEIKSPHDILTHMELKHQIRGKLERAPSHHHCCNCPFEDNGKGKLARHQIACAKKFKPETNLAPPIEWEPPAKILKIARARNNMLGSYQNAFSRQVGSSMVRTPINIANLMVGASSAGATGSGGYRPRARLPLLTPSVRTPVQGVPIMRAGGLPARQNNPPTALSNNFVIGNNAKSKTMHQPSISITPLPRHPQPAPSLSTSQTKNTFVICEICDGYIKDLEQLRNHMQWIHKVKIHPKMIYNRPPLNCQKCQFRFFTDQGLERHLLGSHGLVTSSMQEAANKGKDAGRCPVCGRVYQWKLLSHVARDHNLTLKPAHLSYKCTVCTATFGMYKQFENHVYSAHSVVAKRVMDKSKTTAPPSKPNDPPLLKPLKINDEITIIPQMAKPPTSTKTK